MMEMATTSDIRCGLSTSSFFLSLPNPLLNASPSITVSEPHNSSDEDGALSSSSLITMPNAAPEKSSVPSVGPTRLTTATTVAATTDTLSDVGSDDSDLSIIDVPSSPSLSSAHSDAFEDPHEEPTPVPPVPAQGNHNLATPNNDFVVLYDTETDDD